MIKTEDPVYTPAVKIYNLPNGDCSFQHGSLPNNVKIEATNFWFQNHTDIYEEKLHPAPRLQYVITLKGKLKFTVSDGSHFIIEPGIIIVAADTNGPGHSWKMLEGDVWERIYLPITGNEEKYFTANSAS